MYDLRYWSIVFFFNDTATTEIYTLSLHDALPILRVPGAAVRRAHAIPDKLPLSYCAGGVVRHHHRRAGRGLLRRSEEHTSELQSPCNIVCRLLLEKKKNDHSLTADSPRTMTTLRH